MEHVSLHRDDIDRQPRFIDLSLIYTYPFIDRLAGKSLEGNATF